MGPRGRIFHNNLPSVWSMISYILLMWFAWVFCPSAQLMYLIVALLSSWVHIFWSGWDEVTFLYYNSVLPSSHSSVLDEIPSLVGTDYHHVHNLETPSRAESFGSLLKATNLFQGLTWDERALFFWEGPCFVLGSKTLALTLYRTKMTCTLSQP